MGMLTITSKADHRLSLEGNLQAVHAEYLTDESADNQLVIGSLQSISKLPVNLNLLANAYHAAGLIQMSLDAAYFLVAHLNAQSVLVQQQNCLLQGIADNAVGALPVLLLHNLGSGHFLNVGILQRSLYPELQLSSGSEADILHISTIDMLQAGDSTGGVENVQQLLLYIIQSILQNCTRIYTLALVNEESRNTESTDRLLGFLIVVLEVVIYKPVYRWVNRHINLCIVQGCNACQHYGGAVSLYCGTGVEIIHILQKDAYRNLLISVVAGVVNTNQGNEFDFRMSLQHLNNSFFLRVRRNDIE